MGGRNARSAPHRDLSAPFRGYVDGALAAPLPVRIARALGAQRVVAVDTTFHAEPVVPDGIVDSVFRAGMVMARHLAAAERAAADLTLDPVLPPVREVRLDRRDALIEAGAAAARAELARLRRLFAPQSAPAGSGEALRARMPPGLDCPVGPPPARG
jgi:NTE family protein